MSIRLDDIGSYALPIFYTVITHPLTHARTLMQLGYEPIPKYLGHSVLSSFGIGNKVYKYPSIFTYCKHMRNEIGLVGIFTIGLPARIVYWNISALVSDVILCKLNGESHLTEGQSLNTDADFHEYIHEVKNLTIARSVAVIIAYPFQVFMVRQMAEIINEGTPESKLMFSLFLNILDDEGILGLYGGLKAKLIGEIATIWLTAGFVYVFNKYVLKDRVGNDIKNHSPTLGGLLCSNLTYRFSVISTVMAVGSAKKMITELPQIMPVGSNSIPGSRIRQNFHTECEDKLNAHIVNELHASYVYQAMRFYFDRDDLALSGVSNYFKKQSIEGRSHAEKLMKYLNKRGGRIVLQDIPKPKENEWTVETAFQSVLELEKSINQSLLDLHKTGEKHRDPQMMDFLMNEFLKEQIESINEIGNYLTNIRRNGSGTGYYLFDRLTLSE